MAVPTLLMGACSQGGAASSGSGIEPADHARPGIRAEVTTLVELARSLDGYELRLISQCMSDRGQTYEVPSAESPPVFEKTYGFTVEEVQNGYPPLPTLPPDPNAQYALSGSQADQKTWNEALFGTETARQTQTLSDGSGEISGPGEGCIAHARQVMFGSPSTGLEVVNLAVNLPASALKAAVLDPAMEDLNDVWSQCMGDKGHDVRTTDEAVSAARGLGESTTVGKRMANDHVQCEETVSYASARRALEDRYLTGLMDSKEGQIVGARETFNSAITKAKRELSSA